MLERRSLYDYQEDILLSLDGKKSTNKKDDGLKFSNTQKWAHHHLKVANDKDLKRAFNNFDKIFSMEPPPLNSSQRVQQEILYLKKTESLRSQKLIRRIKNEKFLYYSFFDIHLLGNLFSDDSIREKFTYINNIYLVVYSITMNYKKKFDRVRPSFLDPILKPVIDVPMHPSYPSGHGTASYFFASFLSYVDPKRKKEFFKSAFEIAKNREYAGLHYPSDSQAGKKLGMALFDFFMKDPSLVKKMNRYKKFYSNRGFDKIGQ